MAGESSAEFACGQVLFGLKMSNLNYVVKETPFSAYVTIRKKFVKEPIEREKFGINCTEKDLKEEIKDLKTNIALAKVELDENEIKYDSLNEENKKLEDSIENLL